MAIEKTVIVLGGGIVGICSALALMEGGLKVVLIDKQEPGQGASYGNAGVISPWSVVPQSIPGLWRYLPGWLLNSDGPIAIRPRYLPTLLPWGIKFLNQGTPEKIKRISEAMSTLNRSNVMLYRSLLRNTGNEHLITDSYYVHAFRQEHKIDVNSADYQFRKARGAVIERIGQQELRVLEPSLAKDFKGAVLIKGQARTLAPGEVGRVLLGKFLALGGTVLTENIQSLNPKNGGWKLTTTSQVHQSDTVVIAMGAWSAKLLQSLEIKVPLEAERGYHIRYPDSQTCLNHSVMDVDLKLVASSMSSGLRLAGTAEFTGLDRAPSEKRISSLISIAGKMIPSLKEQTPKTWMGTRPSMPDSLPCIGESKKHPGLFTAFGHGHCGFMMAPRTGELIAELVLGKSPSVDLDCFRPERFNS